jgi:hypothetical protein
VRGDELDEVHAVARLDRAAGDRAEDRPVVGEHERRAQAERHAHREGQERDVDVVRQHLAGERGGLLAAHPRVADGLDGLAELAGHDAQRRVGSVAAQIPVSSAGTNSRAAASASSPGRSATVRQ